MPDFRKHVREHLPPIGLRGEQELEVMEELALELHERYEAALVRGVSPDEAWRSTVDHVDWNKLATDFRETLKEKLFTEVEPPKRSSAFANFWNTVRFALRLLSRSKGFAITAILTIALGIGPNTAIFSVLYSVFWAPPENPNAVRQSVVWSKHGNEMGYGVRGAIHVSTRDLLEWRRESRSFERLDAVVQTQVTLNDDADYPDRITVQSHTPGAITQYWGTNMALGRDFLQEEGQPGAREVVIIGNRYWRERYKSDPNVLGKQIRLNGRAHTIVGVLAPSWWDRRKDPMWPCLVLTTGEKIQTQHMLTVLAQRKPGISNEQAEAELNSIASSLARKYPDTNSGWTVSVGEARNSWLNERTRSNLGLLMGAVSLVLLIACFNVANLLMARGNARLKELAIRVSMGATKQQIISQLLVESLVLFSLGGAAGIALAWFFLKLFLGLAPAFWIPSTITIQMSQGVLLFSIGVTLLSGLVFGFAPAWQMAGLGITGSLRNGGSQSGMSVSRHRLGKILIVAEFAIALTLLSVAGVVTRSYWDRMHVDPGIRTSNLLTFELPSRPGRVFKSAEEVTDYNRVLRERIEAVPGVIRVASYWRPPIADSPSGKMAVVRRAPADPAQYPQVRNRLVGPGFFETFGVQVAQGRQFNDHDLPNSTRVVMVNATFAKKYLEGLDPLLEEVISPASKFQPQLKYRIVGVYKDIQNGEQFGGPVRPEIIAPLSQWVMPNTSMAVQTDGEPTRLSRSIAAAIHEFDAEMPMTNVRTMEKIIEEATAFDRFEAALYGSFGLLSLLLSGIGIYGLLAFIVSQRSSELGVRIALGADTRSIFGLVIREGLVLAGVGLVLGGAGAYYATRLLQSTLYGMNAGDPWALGAVGLILLAAALIACIIPAWRASVVDPLRSLREV